MANRSGYTFLGAAVTIVLLSSSSATAMDASTASVSAASPNPTIGIDPLIAVSLFGTATSAAAVQSVAAQEAAQITCPPGTVLRPPLANQPPGPPKCVRRDVPEVPIPPPAPSAFAFIPLIAVAAVGAAAAGGGKNGSGNLSPVSPS